MININLLTEYISFFSFVSLAVGFCVFLLFLSWILGGRSQSRYKHTPFESGIASVGNTDLHFSIKFYLVAIFFVIFDVEALYLYAWSISVLESGWIGFCEAAMFIISLFIALCYLIRIKALNWVK